ncbi:MAG: LysM peptidoglycan-binding domain-containing protein [Actinomycetales bacterium]|nr:LysM peptidoglycan-binding domain-containing protein [Actinomycetales bacterium]
MSVYSPSTPGFVLTAPRPRLRLTPRGRAVLGALAIVPLVLAALVFGWGASGAEAGSTPSDVIFATVTVHPGDSLWSIAERVAPDADPAEVVADLTRLNNLSGAALQPGEELAVPAVYAG